MADSVCQNIKPIWSGKNVDNTVEKVKNEFTLLFQHVLVMPNMDDLVVPILSAGNDAEPQSPVPQSRSGSEV